MLQILCILAYVRNVSRVILNLMYELLGGVKRIKEIENCIRKNDHKRHFIPLKTGWFYLFVE